MTLRIPALAMAGLVLAGAAHAAGYRALDCNGVQPEPGMQNVGLAQVIAKANFAKNESERAHCPTADAACTRHAFLLPGDAVLGEAGTGAAGPYGCIAYVSEKGIETDGWFPAANLKPLASPTNWAGKWKRDTSAEIDIAVKGDTAHLTGNATANSGSAVNEGDLDGDIDARAPYASFAIAGDRQIAFARAGQDDCAVELRQLGPYLLVQDNNNCGGMGVSFSGLYRKH